MDPRRLIFHEERRIAAGDDGKRLCYDFGVIALERGFQLNIPIRPETTDKRCHRGPGNHQRDAFIANAKRRLAAIGVGRHYGSCPSVTDPVIRSEMFIVTA